MAASPSTPIPPASGNGAGNVGVSTPPQPMPNDGSIVDFLNKQGIPSDKNTRAQLYESLGLGSQQDYLNGTTSGTTSAALLNHLTQNPNVVSAIVSGIKGGHAVSDLKLGANASPGGPQQATGGVPGENPLVYQSPGALKPAPTGKLASMALSTPSTTQPNVNRLPGETQAQYDARMAAYNKGLAPTPNSTALSTTPDNSGNTLPNDVQSINDFQQKFLSSYNTNQAEADAAQKAMDQYTTPLTADQLLAQQQDIQQKEGYTAEYQKYQSLLNAYNSTETQLRQEVASTGGVMSESQIQAEVANRQKLMKPELDALSNDLATKKALVDTIMSEAQNSRDQAASKAEALLSLYNGNAKAALDSAASYYHTEVQIDNQQMSDKISTALKYGLQLTPDQLMNMSYADVAKMAMPKASSLNDYMIMQKQMQAYDAQIKYYQAVNPLGSIGFSGVGGGGSGSPSMDSYVQAGLATTDSSGNTQLTPQGKAQFLSQFNPGVANMITAAASYKLDPTKITSLRTNQRAQFIAAVEMINPNFDMTSYPARQKMMENVTSGTYSQAITAANTLIKHLGVMSADAKNTASGSIPALNAVQNFFATQTGGSGPSNFMEAAQAVASEAMKVYAGAGGGSTQDIQAWKDSLSPNMSQSQKEGAIKQMIDLMAGKLGTITNQYETVMGNPPDFSTLTPDALKTLTSLGGDPTQLGYVHMTAPDGSTGWVPQGNVSAMQAMGYTNLTQ